MNEYTYKIHAFDLETQVVVDSITVRKSQITLAGMLAIVFEKRRLLESQYPNTRTTIDRIQ